MSRGFFGLLLLVSLPAVAMEISLQPGELFFRADGRPSFLLGRNPTGTELGHFDELLTWAAASGERILRIHLTTGFQPRAAAGAVDEVWAGQWERVFDLAAAKGLHVLPVFGVWADWNDGSDGLPWHQWDKNPFNAAKGGPARSPAELFGDTECRRLWLGWLEALVKRWQARPNILGWEVFSELDLVTGATEAAATPFVERAAKLIRASDSRRRPVMASLSGVGEWPRLFASPALDCVQIHPYADGLRGNLDELILTSVRERLRRYGKPVFIGESGLDSRGARDGLANAPRAGIGIRHALWAALVSGAMNGRMLWWEDGYDRYQQLDLRAKHALAAKPVAAFAAGVDFTGFRPVEVALPRELKSAALGNGRVVIAWFRDARCEPPDWPLRSVAGQRVTLSLPGTAREWAVEFYETISARRIGSGTARRERGAFHVELPAFEGSIALKLVARD
jgi:hypothetical protein